MSPRRLALVALVVATWTAPAPAATTTIGSNLGFGFLIPRGNGNTLFTLAAPSSPGLFTIGFQPGLRLGFISNQAMDEFYLDLGLHLAHVSERTTTNFVGSANYQRTLGSGGRVSPYVTLGAGLFLLGVEEESFVNAMIGGGIGTRTVLGHGHGSWRFEGRADYIAEDRGRIDSALMISAKLGFDLWLQ